MKKQEKINDELIDIEKREELLAYDEKGKTYEVFESIGTYVVGNCLGSIYFVYDKLQKLISMQLPLMRPTNGIKIENVDEVKKKAKFFNKLKRQIK